MIWESEAIAIKSEIIPNASPVEKEERIDREVEEAGEIKVRRIGLREPTFPDMV
jgi:hypothetical protein